jgi:hypothetical protein
MVVAPEGEEDCTVNGTLDFHPQHLLAMEGVGVTAMTRRHSETA